MKLSVVVPAFNEARYLPRSLSSLRQAELFLGDQTAVSTEVIVVDNASTDATARVARDFLPLGGAGLPGLIVSEG